MKKIVVGLILTRANCLCLFFNSFDSFASFIGELLIRDRLMRRGDEGIAQRLFMSCQIIVVLKGKIVIWDFFIFNLVDRR